MMDDRNALFSQQTFARAVEFVWREAELLDRRDYRAWLDLWDPAGHYVVPIDPAATDFAATLNYVYDDHDMREKRVQRMLSGYSASASDAARTVRTVSRFTLESGAADTIELKSAQLVVAYKRGAATLFGADITHRLRIDAEGDMRIAEKVVRLIDSTEALSAIGFLL
ncbi:aromatic-ring-hydroxylating dioxygenase subunit beta [Burkholderia sp. MR1-5-21]